LININTKEVNITVNINIGDRYQLNTIVPQHNRYIFVERTEQRIAAQNITKIDKKIKSIDKEIEAREKFIVNNNKIIKAVQESKKNYPRRNEYGNKYLTT